MHDDTSHACKDYLKGRNHILSALLVALTSTHVVAADAPKMKMTTTIPKEITVPDAVKTRLGTLKFLDGLPDQATVQKLYNNLDFMRGVEVYLNTMEVASTVSQIRGLRSVGANRQTVVVHENRVDAKTLLLTPNNQTATLWGYFDLKDGPIVLEIPPKVLGLADDAWMRFVIDMGMTGPDKGEGGKFLFLPPGYRGDVPTGYFVARPRTYSVTYGLRGFTVKGDTTPAVEAFRKYFRVYQLAQAANPPETKIINGSGLYFNTIAPNTFEFYEQINSVIQEEPENSADPEILGQLAAIGITKGKPFAPDARMKKILEEAAAVASATARALVYRPRDKMFYFYPDSKSAWFTPFVGGSHEFIQHGVRLLDARSTFMYVAAGITPAMSVKIVGGGSQYAVATFDSEDHYLDGSKTYRLHLPPNIPVNNFWSLIPYDTQTRSILQTDQRDATLSSETGTVKVNADGSVDAYFGPKMPPGKEGNWIQTVPGKGWFVILRLYGALEPWFDKTWRPGEIQLIK